MSAGLIVTRISIADSAFPRGSKVEVKDVYHRGLEVILSGTTSASTGRSAHWRRTRGRFDPAPPARRGGGT